MSGEPEGATRWAARDTAIGAIAGAANVECAFATISALAQTVIGHRLFTIMFYDASAMTVQRVYSSNPDTYPAGGRKAKRATWWGRHVLVEGRPYIGRNADDIRAHFSDHEVIAGLGLASILNLPVRVCGRTIGTMNLLHEDGFYHEAHVEPGLTIAGLAAAPLLLTRGE